jgi:acetyl esterase/lipase
MLIFVHGGGWTAGDKGEVVAGVEVYRNIGRFAAAHGIGAAVINYRLQPRVTWREQVADVARAVRWVHGHAEALGGDPDALFLSGHSAGAQLIAYVALNPAPLAELGLSPKALCGVIPVSGAGYDLTDETTYELGARRSYYERRFAAGEPDGVWQREASAMSFLSPDAPPFLLLHGTREWKSLRYQNRLLDQALRRAGVPSRLRVARQTHASMVLALSRGDKLPGREVLAAIHGSRCRERQR